MDFSKTFDTVRHSNLLDKMTQLDLLREHAYNWLVVFFTEHSHCTVYNGQLSTMKKISVSSIPVSAISDQRHRR